MARRDSLDRLLRSLAVLEPHLDSLPRRREIPSELSLGAARALWALATSARDPGVGELAARLDTTPPRASRLLRDLEGRGLVARRRDLDDQRRVSVRLSARGRRLVNTLLASRTARLEALLDVLGAHEAEQLTRVFERAAARLQSRLREGARPRPGVRA